MRITQTAHDFPQRVTDTPLRRRGRSQAMRERRAEREMKLRERENERIAKIHKRMDRIHARPIDPELCPKEQAKIREQRDNMLGMLAAQIARIMEKRAEREAANLELEAREMQAKLEEHIREREEQAEKAAEQQPTPPKEREEEELAAERSTLKGILRNEATRSEIRELSRVRAARSMEALQLRHAIDSPNSWGFVVTGEGADARTTQVPSGRGETDSFRVTHLRKLEKGIARLDEAIMQRVADMYSRSVQDGEQIKSESSAQEERDSEDGVEGA